MQMTLFVLAIVNLLLTQNRAELQTPTLHPWISIQFKLLSLVLRLVSRRVTLILTQPRLPIRLKVILFATTVVNKVTTQKIAI